MRVRLFALPVNERGEIDTSAIDDFGAKYDILQVWEHVTVAAQQPVWLVMLATRDAGPTQPRDATTAPPRRPAISVPDEPLFVALRDWRNGRARKAGVPPFLILNNRQLEAVAAARPTTLASLGAIPGVGAARLGDYGEEILAVVAGVGASKAPEGSTDG
jgi:superfamily II DNA helicase RecQ